MRVAVVTGATGGIGRHVARGMAAGGTRVVLVGRDPARGEAALRWLREEVPGAEASLELADLSSLSETRALGARIAAAHGQVSVLVNNAGVFHSRRTETPEGREAVLATNHLSPFLLTGALEAALRAGAPARVVLVGSDTAERARLDPSDLELRRSWGMKRSYARAKLALLLTGLERARRWSGSGIDVNVVHPGLVATGLVRTGGVIGLAWRLMALWARTEAEGADTPLFAALDPSMERRTGLYLKDRRSVPPNPLANDEALIQATWAQTERLIAATTTAPPGLPAAPPPRG